MPADVAEIVEQKHIDGVLSYYVHYVDRKRASGQNLHKLAKCFQWDFAVQHVAYMSYS